MTHFAVILSSVALVLSVLSLLLTLALRLMWSPHDVPPEQQAEVADNWKRMLKIIWACLAVSILLWLMATHLSAHNFGLSCLALFLATPALGRLLPRLSRGASVVRRQ